MAKPWYRTDTWTDEDDRLLPGRLRRYKDAYSRAQVLRIKALQLEKSGRAAFLPIVEMLLRTVTDDPEMQRACSHTGVACEVSSCHLKLALIHAGRGEDADAEVHFRNDLAINRTPGSGVNFALFLSKSDDPAKLSEAERLLDQVRDTKDPPQLMFRVSQLRYSVARARLCAKAGRPTEAREYATAALALDGVDGIDAFKRRPMDEPLLDAQTRNEMEQIKQLAGEE